jgi:nucleoid-associated protein YgaU
MATRLRGPRRPRGVVLGTAVLVAYGGACGLLAWGTDGLLAATAEPTARLNVLLGLAACAAAWGVLTWLAATSVLAVAAAAAGEASPLRPMAARLAPAVVRRAAVLALGAGLAGATVCPGALPAAADRATGTPVTAPPAAGVGGPGRPALDRPADDLRGWTPDRPAPATRTRGDDGVHLVTTAPRAGTSVSDEVVVRRGDSLWDIAARHLGPGATAAEVAAEWPRWYAANRGAVGADPDLIRPGQRLSPPRR